MSPQEYMQRLEKLYASGKREFLAIKADTSEIFTDALPFLRMDGGDAYDEDGRGFAVRLRRCRACRHTAG